MVYVLIVITTSFLVYSYGANDNFKRIATLFGDNKRAIIWTTNTTATGSVVFVFLSSVLIRMFFGKKLSEDQLVESRQFTIFLGTALIVTFAFTLSIAAIISTLVYFIIKNTIQ